MLVIQRRRQHSSDTSLEEFRGHALVIHGAIVDNNRAETEAVGNEWCDLFCLLYVFIPRIRSVRATPCQQKETAFVWSKYQYEEGKWMYPIVVVCKPRYLYCGTLLTVGQLTVGQLLSITFYLAHNLIHTHTNTYACMYNKMFVLSNRHCSRWKSHKYTLHCGKTAASVIWTPLWVPATSAIWSLVSRLNDKICNWCIQLQKTYSYKKHIISRVSF